MTTTYILTLSCPDRTGIVAKVSGFIAQHKGWILETALHAEPATDAEHRGRYFMRIEIRADSLPFMLSEFRERFAPIAEELQMDWKISDSAVKKRVVVLVSKQEHCLYDLLARWQARELDIEIPCVISNHDTFKGFVEWHGIPFHHVPAGPDNKREANAEIARLFEQAQGGTLLIDEVGDLPRRDIDRDGERHRAHPLAFGHVDGGLAEHPGADGNDLPALFGDRDEAVGRDDAHCRVVPARQNLETLQAACCQVDLLFEIRLKFARRNGAAHRHFQLRPRLQFALHRGVEPCEAVPALLLCRIHGYIGAPHQGVDGVAIGR